MDLQVSCYTFGAKPSFINRKVIARLNTHDVIVFNKEVHSALNRAIRAVRRHHAIDHSIRAPATVRRVVKMRSIRLNDLIEMFDFTHVLFLNPETPSQLQQVSWHMRVRA